MDSDQDQDTSKDKEENTAKNNLSVTRLYRSRYLSLGHSDPSLLLLFVLLHKQRNIKYRIFIILQLLNKLLTVEADVSVPLTSETRARKK
jgi:hypothetical protein